MTCELVYSKSNHGVQKLCSIFTVAHSVKNLMDKTIFIINML